MFEQPKILNETRLGAGFLLSPDCTHSGLLSRTANNLMLAWMVAFNEIGRFDFNLSYFHRGA
jgi:hypothetical protein